MPEKKESGKKLKPVGMRLSFEEMQRLEQVTKSIHARNPYVSTADILREMAGFVNTGLVTDEERKIIAGSAPPLMTVQVPIISPPRAPEHKKK